MSNVIDTKSLLKPISKTYPCGEDMSFSHEFDEIKEARRADDPTLSQGDWVTDLKEADWTKVLKISIDLLTNATKDLQLLGWLSEALTKLEGLAGLQQGLDLTIKTLDTFWDHIYPQPDGDDLEDREIRLEWFIGIVATAIENISLTENPPYTLLEWKSAKEIDNQIRLEKETSQSIKDAGKIDTQTFMAAVNKTPIPFYEKLLKDIEKVNETIHELAIFIEDKFPDTLNVRTLNETLSELKKTVEKISAERGVNISSPSVETIENTPNPIISTDQKPPTSPVQETKKTTMGASHHASIQSRQEALKQLHNLAQFFHQTEPHSPVAFLVDRAVKWGNMNLQDWLKEMIKDDQTLFGIQETLGISKKPYNISGKNTSEHKENDDPDSEKSSSTPPKFF